MNHRKILESKKGFLWLPMKSVGYLLGLLFMCWVLCNGKADAFSSEQIVVRDPRPLAAAILILESRAGKPITYEDPPYLYPAEISTSPEGPLIPKGGTIDFSYNSENTTGSTLQSLLNGREGSQSIGTFTLISDEGFYHVVPSKYRDVKGELVPNQSPLDAQVTIEREGISGFEILNVLGSQVSEKTDKKFVIGMVPQNPLSSPLASFSCRKEKARQCLVKLIKATGTNLSWQIFYDPKLHWYVLNIHRVGYTGN